MFTENALIKLAEGSLEEFVGKEELWQVTGSFHLKFEDWSKSKHSKPSVFEGYEGWTKINKKHPSWLLEQLYVQSYGRSFWRYEKYRRWNTQSSKCFKAKIQVKRNQCGSVPAALEIKNFNRGNFFLCFGDFEMIEPPLLTKGHLSLEDFSNPFDLQVNQTLKDEGLVEDSFISEGVEYLRSIQFTRNPFEALE